MHSVRKPWWQQATALVTVSTGGVITGFTFVPGAAATMTSPSNVPLHLMALEKAAKPADTGDDKLRPAIVNVAGYYLQLAQTRTPAQMEALIWGRDSLDGADHGPSCAAFASLTLELAAQAVGQQSWVSGGATYPWPLHEWADVRVNPNPDSLGVTSIVQDAQAHQRWHPLGDGYQPQPGDWVVFDGHVEVVTSYSNGVLDTIGADSLPNLTVNAHSFPDPLAQQGVEGFVDNGHLAEATAASGTAPAAAPAPVSGAGTSRGTRSSAQPQTAAIPGVVAPGGRRRRRAAGYVRFGRVATGQRRAVPRQSRPLRAPRGVPPRRPRRTSRVPRWPPGLRSPRRVRPARGPQLPAGRPRPTGSTPRRPLPRRGRKHSRRSSIRSRQVPSPRSSVTACLPPSPSRRPSTSPGGELASSPRLTTTCSASRAAVPRAASRCRRRSSRTASGSRSTPSSASITTSQRASPTTRSSSPPAGTTRAPWQTAQSPTPSRTT